MKYFETNALREFAGLLNKTDFVKDKFTSILSILEILTGIKDEKSFQLRKAILKKILFSEIKIVKYFPEIILLKSFGFDINNDNVCKTLFRISFLIIDCKSFEDFLEKVVKNGFKNDWGFLIKYDENAAIEFKRKVEQNFGNSDLKQLINRFKSRWVFENFFQLKNEIVRFFAQTAINIFPSESSKSIFEVISLYDHSIDIYLFTMTFYLDEKNSFKKNVGKNDYLDINHLLYLRNNNYKIVTEDKLVISLMSKLNFDNFLQNSMIKSEKTLNS